MTHPAQSPVLSVVTPNWNRIDTLERTLLALEAQELSVPYEIIVVDDCSSDGSWSFLRDFARRHPRLTAVQTPANGGAAVARNVGLARARGLVLVFVDADVVCRPDTLATLWDFHQRTPQNETVALGQVRFPPEWTPTALFSLMDPTTMWQGLTSGATVSWQHFYTGLIAARTAFLRQANGFNEQLQRMEDTELGARLHRLGMTLYYLPEAIGYHYHPRTFHQIVAQSRGYGRALAQLSDSPDPLLRTLATESWLVESSPRALAKRCAGALIGNPLAQPLAEPLLAWLLDHIPALGLPVAKLFLFHAARQGYASTRRMSDKEAR